MKRREFLQALGAGAMGLLLPGCMNAARSREARRDRPNVVVIFADDLGYGDLGCYGAAGVRTPHIDALAAGGMRFTDAHAASSVCTPARYGLLTGRYPWRRPKMGDINIWPNDGLLIDPKRLTLADIFKRAGYATGCVGKWHLGFGDPEPDWNGKLAPGPLELGFDYYFGVPVSNNWPPFVYVENHQVIDRRSDEDIQPFLFAPQQPNAPKRDDETIALTQTRKAVSFIESHRGGPFFLYMAPCNVHFPLTPNGGFRGTSGIGVYGDFIHELDWTVGEITAALKKNGLFENTLILFTSDNGAYLDDTTTAAGHRPNAPWRGQKGDIYEGGHRVPMIAHRPGHIPAGRTSDALVCQTDLMATFAAMLKQKLPRNAAEDSFDLSGVLRGESGKFMARNHILYQSSREALALRVGDWKYVPILGSAGFSEPAILTAQPGGPRGQLYNLADDPGEEHNLWMDYPGKAAEMDALLRKMQAAGRTRAR